MSVKLYEVKKGKGQMVIGQITVLRHVNRIFARFVVGGETAAKVELDRRDSLHELKVSYASDANGYDHFTLARKLVQTCVTEHPTFLDSVEEVSVTEEIKHHGKGVKLSFPGLDRKLHPKCAQPAHWSVMEVIGEEVESAKRLKVM
jgi:hypothetical protein